MRRALCPYPAMGGQGQTVDLKGDNIVGNLSSTLSPSLFNELRFGFSKFDTALRHSVYRKPESAVRHQRSSRATASVMVSIMAWTRFSPSGYAEIGARSFWPNFNNLANYMITDSLLWQRGKHTIKFGGEFRFLNIYRDAAQQRRGNFTFSGAFTSERPNAARAAETSVMASPTCCSAGLAAARTATIKARTQRSVLCRVHPGRLENRTKSDLQSWSAIRVLWFGNLPRSRKIRPSVAICCKAINVATAAEEKSRSRRTVAIAAANQDRNNWAPRLGFAWSLTDKTVIRTGAGSLLR